MLEAYLLLCFKFCPGYILWSVINYNIVPYLISTFQYPILVCSCKSLNWCYFPIPIAFCLLKSHIPLNISVFTLHCPFIVDNQSIIWHKVYAYSTSRRRLVVAFSIPSCPHLKITQPLFISFPVCWAHAICLALKHWDGAFWDIPTDYPTQHMVIATNSVSKSSDTIKNAWHKPQALVLSLWCCCHRQLLQLSY